MIEEIIKGLVGQIPGLFFGGVAGIVCTFFYIQHKLKSDPQWVENLYQKQRAVGMKGTEKVDELEAKVKAFEYKEAYDKMKADIIKELKG